MNVVEQFSEWAGIPQDVAAVLGSLLWILLGGSIARILWLRFGKYPAAEVRSRLGSLATWWTLFLALILIVLLGRNAAIILFGGCSLLGLQEYRKLESARLPDRTPWRWAYAVVAIHYWLIYLDWFPAVWIFLPVLVFLSILAGLALQGQADKYLQAVGITYAGLMLVVFFFSHALLVLGQPNRWNPISGSLGAFVYLILLTELNDIFQALIGRALGRRKIAPRVSPAKTWAGFLGGAVATVLAAVLLAPG